MPTKILVLEDVEALLVEVAETLEDQDYQVSTATRPEQAVDLARWNEFDLFLTDVRMAGPTDGIGALEAVKKIRPSVYSIIMTGYTDDDAPARAMRQGVDYYLYKPFGMVKLLKAVEQVLETQRENSTYQHQLSQFFKASKRYLANLTGRGDSPGQLDRERVHCMKALFAGTQSKNLTLGACIDLWDQLVALEVRNEQLQQFIGEQADELAHAYRVLRERAETLATSRHPGSVGTRKPEQIPVPLFAKLYNRIADGAVSLPAMIAAPTLWHACHQSKRKPPDSLVPLWTLLFGDGLA